MCQLTGVMQTKFTCFFFCTGLDTKKGVGICADNSMKMQMFCKTSNAHLKLTGQTHIYYSKVFVSI